MSTQAQPATLYVVATPIGHLDDISRRAIDVLATVDLIAAEDTRHSGQLLQALGVQAELLSFHEHNEDERMRVLLERLQQGAAVALISDAGTPLISDPGFVLVRACREAGIAVVPVPGPSALIAALSVSGLPSDRFQFEGFLPRSQGKRQARLLELKNLPHTVICYESSHRLRECLADMHAVLGADRQAVIARELTKHYETILSGTVTQLLERVIADANQERGELVILLAPYSGDEDSYTLSVEQMLRAALNELPPSQAAVLVARLTGLKKKPLYQLALTLQGTAT